MDLGTYFLRFETEHCDWGGHVKSGAQKIFRLNYFLVVHLPLVEGSFLGNSFQTEVVYMGFPTMMISNQGSHFRNSKTFGKVRLSSET